MLMSFVFLAIVPAVDVIRMNKKNSWVFLLLLLSFCLPVNLCFEASGVCKQLWYCMLGHFSSQAPLSGCFCSPVDGTCWTEALTKRLCLLHAGCFEREWGRALSWREQNKTCMKQTAQREARWKLEMYRCAPDCCLRTARPAMAGGAALPGSTTLFIMHLQLQMLLKNKVRWKYLLFPSDMCLAEPTPALSSVGKAVLPGLHHPDVNLGYVPLSASK